MFLRSLRIALWVLSLSSAATYVALATSQLGRSSPLDPMEPVLLDHAARLAAHGPLYVEPEGDVLPPSVMPGFPACASVLVSMFGPEWWTLRLLALCATLVTAALVVMVVRAETGNGTLGFAAGGLLLGGHLLTSSEIGVAATEPLMLALALAGFATLRFQRGIWGALAGSVLFAAAYFTQQIGAWLVAAALLHLLVDDRRRALAFVLGLAALIGGVHVALSLQLGQPFNTNAWALAVGALGFHPRLLVEIVGDQLLGRLGVLTLACVLSFALPIRPWRGAAGIWTCMALGTLGASLVASQMADAGGRPFLVTLLAVAILGPISMQRVTRHLSAWPGSSRLGGQGVVLVGLLLQFTSLACALATEPSPARPAATVEGRGARTPLGLIGAPDDDTARRASAPAGRRS